MQNINQSVIGDEQKQICNTIATSITFEVMIIYYINMLGHNVANGILCHICVAMVVSVKLRGRAKGIARITMCVQKSYNKKKAQLSYTERQKELGFSPKSYYCICTVSLFMSLLYSPPDHAYHNIFIKNHYY